MYELNICHLYPDLLNLYGDRGNLIAVRKRCEWMGIKTNIAQVSIGDDFDSEKYDIVLIGGGQDYEQELIRPDIVNEKSAEIKSYIENGKVMLAICGGYQLLGRYYQTSEGEILKFLGALDFVTVAGEKRLIGNIIFECGFLKSDSDRGLVVGFENHMGRTYLGAGVKPMGQVIRGYGNNGEDQLEGAIYKNTFCSYSHGSLLPRNSRLADYLISTALRQKYDQFTLPVLLNDSFEKQAHHACLVR